MPLTQQKRQCGVGMNDGQLEAGIAYALSDEDLMSKGLPEPRRDNKNMVWLCHEDVIFRNVVHVFGHPLQKSIGPIQDWVALHGEEPSSPGLAQQRLLL